MQGGRTGTDPRTTGLHHVMAESDPRVPLDGSPGASPAIQRGRPSALRIAGRILTGLLVALFVSWLVLYLTEGRFLKASFERIASRSLDREVKVGGDFQLYFDPLTIKFVAERMAVANPAWRKGDFFRADRIDARIATLPLITGERRVQWLDMSGARLDLAWDRTRQRNTFTFGDPTKPKPNFELPDIVRAQIIRTSVDYADPLMQLATHFHVETIKANDTRFADDVNFTGEGTLRAKPFTLSGRMLSPNATAAGGENRLTLLARSGSTSLDVSGTLPGATILEGAKLKLDARGPNLSNLLDFLGVAIPETRTYHVRSDLTKTQGVYKLTAITGRFGNSDLGGSATFALPDNRLKIDADLHTRRLDIVDAGPFLGYSADRLAKGQVATFAAGHPRLIPDAPIRIEAIKLYEADVKYHVAALSGVRTPISKIALTLSLDHSLLKLAPLTLDLAGGKIWSNVTIDARRPAVFTTYDIRLSQTPLARLLGQSGVVESGATGSIRGRVQMTGTGDSLRKSLASSNGRIAIVIPQGTFWQRNAQLAELDVGVYLEKLLAGELKQPVKVNCGLVAFTVRNGVAAADPILIDTQKNIIVGRGGFSFRTEALDFAVRAHGKTFSLFSGQSPIGVKGIFAKPALDVISPQLMARAGVGLGLGVIASPFAVILAFVDMGDAKAAQCGPVLAGSHATAQRDTKGRLLNGVGHGTTAKSGESSPASGARRDRHKKLLGIF